MSFKKDKEWLIEQIVWFSVNAPDTYRKSVNFEQCLRKSLEGLIDFARMSINE